ncbi:HAD-IA family hydrolase [Shewanella sp.]|uniref:HAD-IA family hydrolase n=1 Tax=Shewanella sp. TaxID=50422 RepID=UPI003A9802BD
MQCFQKLRHVAAISFDLDDTLYDNHPVLLTAEQVLQAWLLEHFPRTAQWRQVQWRACKLEQLRLQPTLIHDTSAARLATLTAGLLACGYDVTSATNGAQQGLAVFYRERSRFSVAPEVIELLLALQQRYPLIGITNGNVDHQQIGLAGVFERVIHPGHGVRMKPYRDMFDMAAEQLNIPLSQLLHVGDNPVTDVDGARRAGAQAVWLTPAYGRATAVISGQRLPHWRISQIGQLHPLLLGAVG